MMTFFQSNAAKPHALTIDVITVRGNTISSTVAATRVAVICHCGEW